MAYSCAGRREQALIASCKGRLCHSGLDFVGSMEGAVIFFVSEFPPCTPHSPLLSVSGVGVVLCAQPGARSGSGLSSGYWDTGCIILR